MARFVQMTALDGYGREFTVWVNLNNVSYFHEAPFGDVKVTRIAFSDVEDAKATLNIKAAPQEVARIIQEADNPMGQS